LLCDVHISTNLAFSISGERTNSDHPISFHSSLLSLP
jgi:hypothetical protein